LFETTKTQNTHALGGGFPWEDSGGASGDALCKSTLTLTCVCVLVAEPFQLPPSRSGMQCLTMFLHYLSTRLRIYWRPFCSSEFLAL